MRELAEAVRFGKAEKSDTVEQAAALAAELTPEQAACGKYKLNKYVVTKGINKLPHEYPNAKSQAHLQVALRLLAEGKAVNTG